VPGDGHASGEVGSEPAPSGPHALESLQEVWEALAQADPLWAVLSEPERAGRQWDVESFLASGEAQIEQEMDRFAELGGTLPDHQLAIDFGSGVGRLSQPLGARFDRVVGIDISPTMVAVARRLNRWGDRVEYVLNDRPAFSFLESDSVSFVSTMITLQHVPPEAIRGYLDEFFRVAKPGAGIVFQLPSHYSEEYLPAASAESPVPDRSRRATVRLEHPVAPLAPGRPVELKVWVGNAGPDPWLQTRRHPLQVGNHWTDGGGTVIVPDDGRARLPGRVDPGEEVPVPLVVRAPSDPGRYRLQLDVVQEGVAWFAGAGTPGLEVDVRVRRDWPWRRWGGAGPSQRVRRYEGGTFEDLLSSSSMDAPMFEMNGIPRDEVEAIIVGHGATLLGADEWTNEWHSFTYYVQVGP
jgi:SAM-dependent methyltransferase